LHNASYKRYNIQDQAWWCKPIILATWEAEVGGMLFDVSMYKKFLRPYLKNKLGVVVYICHPSYVVGRGRRIMVVGWPGQKLETLSEKQTKSRRQVMWLRWYQGPEFNP
jgi:hypothetical protein